MDLENNDIFLFLSEVLMVERVVFEFFEFDEVVFFIEEVVLDYE